MTITRAIAFLLYLILFFITGYWIGQNPDFYKETIALGRTLPKVFFENEIDLSPLLLQKLESVSHVNFEITYKNPELADLWITDHRFLSKSSDLKLRYHQLQNKTISPDFKISELNATHSLPVAWKIENQKLRILALTAPIQNRSKRSKLVQMLIQSFLSKEYQLELIQNSNWNTTILPLDDLNIQKERKASFIRSQSLIQTKIE